MPYAIYINDELVAYVKKNKAIIERKRASLVEPCLMAYGVSVNMGVDDMVSYPRKLEGFPLKIHDPDMDENKLVKAITVCLGFVSGVRPNIEEIEEKVYEVTVEKRMREETHDEEEIEFETA